MKYARHFMGQAFHGACKPENDGKNGALMLLILSEFFNHCRFIKIIIKA
jgi:hypothetical protein